MGFPSLLYFFFLFILFSFLFPISHSILNPIDFLALQSIHKSLSDTPGSTFLQKWDFTSDPCTFPGLYCDSDRVVALNLGDPAAGSTGLDGRIDPAIGKLSALTEFTAVPGRLMGKIPETVSELTNLRFFAVSRNYLSGEIPAGFGRLRSLHTLDLGYNQLAGSIPPAIGTLPDLSTLVLCHNHLSGQVPSFATSRSLIRVDFARNNMSGSLNPDAFPPSIEYLSLASNRFVGPVDKVLTRLNQISHLDLSMNRFVGAIPPEVFSFPALATLQLERNSFSGPVEPRCPVTVGSVDLSYNRLSGPVSPFLATVRNLYLNNNRFVGRLPAGFVDGIMDGTVQTLYLQHNYLTGIEKMVGPAADVPMSSEVCLVYNCMVPPMKQMSCPLKAGTEKTRPTSQCVEWRS